MFWFSTNVASTPPNYYEKTMDRFRDAQQMRLTFTRGL